MRGVSGSGWVALRGVRAVEGETRGRFTGSRAGVERISGCGGAAVRLLDGAVGGLWGSCFCARSISAEKEGRLADGISGDSSSETKRSKSDRVDLRGRGS